LKILFVTDLHGSTWKYDKLYRVAQWFKADVVVNSGDMLPKNSDLFQQDKFIIHYLNKHFQQFEEAKIHYLCYLGNDDLKIFDPVFEETCRQYEFVSNVAQRRITIQDIEFIGMNWVVDYPFRLKDRCRMDTVDYLFQPQYGTGVLSTAQGWEELANWLEYAQSLPTIADELENLPYPQNMEHSIYIVHMPPAYLGLDVCGHGEEVGSKALYNFLKTHQPKLSLHGHIHESPEVSGTWKARLGKTICIQPGQMFKFTFVTIDLDRMEIVRHTI
jgi:Icc-related predicted phosphoesterase